jgi:chromate transport protein ChrA
VLVGHPSLLVHLLVPGTLAGLPFWLASALFVATTILVLQRLSAEPQDRALTPWSIAKAVVIGVVAALAIQFVFQDLFLVRLP